MTSKEFREFNELRNKAEKYYKELHGVIRQNHAKEKEYKRKEDELKALIKETELIKEEELSKQRELDQLIEIEQKKEKTTRGQKILLLEFLGTLDTIEELKISKGNKIKLLTYIVEATEKSVEQDFNGRKYNINSRLSNISNYSFLVDVCKNLGIKEFEEKAEKMLEKIEKSDSEK
jgi:hypothetical protein